MSAQKEKEIGWRENTKKKKKTTQEKGFLYTDDANVFWIRKVINSTLQLRKQGEREEKRNAK